MRMCLILVTFILTFLLSGCVGTIKDKSAKTSTTVAATSSATFAGVVAGGPVSHNKIWIKFRPATGGSGQFDYHAYINSSPRPTESLNGDSALLDDEGYIVMLISGLEILTSYSVNVHVYDRVNRLYDTNVAYISVMTSDDYRPVFDGVGAIENLGGADALTKLNVRWTTATTDSAAPFDAKYSVSGYKVYYSSSQSEIWDILRESDQNNINMATYPNTSVASILDEGTAETILSGLTPDTTYYIAVRAIDSDTTPRYELNYVIRTGQTYQYQPVEFAGASTASVPKTSAGFSQVNIGWNQCVGCGIYKVYAKPAAVDIGSIHPSNDAAYLLGTVTNLALTSSSFSGLTKNISYKIYMVACVDATCGWDGSSLDEREIKGRSSSLPITSTPPIAPFAIEPPNPTPPSGEAGLSNLDITWQMDTTQGYYTKIRIFRVLDKNGDVSNYSGANFVEVLRTVGVGPYIDPSVNTTPLDYVNNPTSARITNLTTDTEYCFQALPFIEAPDLGVGEEITLEVANRPPVVCGTPVYTAPVFGVTSLFPSCSGITATTLTINWTHPETKNIMTHYEVYSMFANAGIFVFDDGSGGGAWNSGADYTLQSIISEGLNSLAITGLVPGTEYRFGVNTYYDPPGLTPPIRRVPSSETTPGAESTVNCTTQLPDVEHGGWRDIAAIGPKIDGPTTNLIATRTVVPEFMLPDRRIPYEYGQRTSLSAPEEALLTIGDDGNIPGTGSETGIVRLKWADFQISGTSDKLSDYWTSGLIGLGYNVYRIALEDIPATDRPPGMAPLYENIMDADNANWFSATKLRFVVSQHTNTATQAYNIAYTSDAINADTNNDYLISAEYAVTSGSEKVFEIVDYPPESGKTYFYKVVGVFGGVDSDFASPKQLGNVIEIVVPPDNMALVHRWMANMEVCQWMNRGVGDMCKSPNKVDGSFDETLCSDPTKNYRCVFDGISSLEDGDDNGIPDPYDFDPIDPAANFDDGTTRYYDFVRSILYDRFENGCNFTMSGCPSGEDGNKCIGTATPVAADGNVGDVYYEYDNGLCYVKKSATLWRILKDLDPVTEIPTFGPLMISNAAYLPPPHNTAVQEYWWITHNNSSVIVDAVTLNKRLPSKKELYVAIAWYEGLVDGNGWPIAGYIGKMQGNWGTHTSTQRCLQAPDARSSGHSSDYTVNNYPLGNYIRNGSNGSNSSALCVSRYGLQDMSGGNWPELTADRMYCNDVTLECTTDPNDTHVDMVNFTPLDLSGGVSEIHDINWRNGDGTYFGSPNGTISYNYRNYYKAFSSPYVSMSMGLMIDTVGLVDDNSLVNGMLNNGSAVIQYGYLNGDETYADTVSGVRIMLSGGYISGLTLQGRFNFFGNNFITNLMPTARGVVALPINY